MTMTYRYSPPRRRFMASLEMPSRLGHSLLTAATHAVNPPSVLPLSIMRGDSCWIRKRKRELAHLLWPFQGQESRGNSVLKDSKSRRWGVRRAKRDESSESRKRGIMLKSHLKSISRQKKGHKIKDTASYLQVFNRWKVHDTHKWVFLSIDMHVCAMTDPSIWGASSHQAVCVSVPKYPVFPVWLWCKGILAAEKTYWNLHIFPAEPHQNQLWKNVQAQKRACNLH